MWVVMLFGIVSAADYFRTFWRRVDDSVKLRRRRELLRLERRKKRSAMAAGQPVYPQRDLTRRGVVSTTALTPRLRMGLDSIGCGNPQASHASNPPITFMTFSKPARWIRLHAIALRYPPLQCTAIGRS